MSHSTGHSPLGLSTTDEEACRGNGESTSLLSLATSGTSNLVYNKDDASDIVHSVPLVSHDPKSSLLKKKFEEVWSYYCELLEKRPLLVKAVTAFFIMSTADLCAQGIEHWRAATAAAGSEVDVVGHVGVDWPRMARFGVFGLFGAPWSHYYFHYLDQCLPPTAQPCSTTTFLKLVVDQFIQAPILLAIMISLLSLLKWEGLAGMKQALKETYITSLIANWKLWIPASLLNLAFVKPQFRVLYVNIIFFFWIITLSIILNRHNNDTR